MTLQNRAELRPIPFGLTLSKMESAVDLTELKPRYNIFIEANSQQFLVIDGAAWLSMDGEDIVVKAGESCILTTSKNSYPVCVSALGGKTLTYVLK